jgi:hypothetical protein
MDGTQYEIRKLLRGLTGTSTVKRKRLPRTNPLTEYVQALLQPHIVNGTPCTLPFKVVSTFDDHAVYEVQGNPPFNMLVVHLKDGIPQSFELE